MPPQPAEIYEFGDFRLDVNEHKVELRDGAINGWLPEKAFRTLVALLRASGTLVTKEELLSTVWPDALVEENNLGKAVHAIRQFLAVHEPHLDFIETVPKHGYRFISDVRRIDGDENGRKSARGSQVFPGRSPAYDLYIRGKVKAGSENIEDTENAIKVLEAAVAIDPFFAPAYAQLARAYNTRAFKFSSGPQRKLLHENADVAVEKALSLDPNLAEGHFARGLILWTNTKGFPHEQAICAFRRSLELDADSDEAHHQLSMVYSHVGLLDEAHAEVKCALDRNPNNTMARFRVGVYFGYQGKRDEALRVFKTIPRDVSPMLVDRCQSEVLVQAGRTEEAAAIVEQQLSKNTVDEGGSFASVKAVLLAMAGNRKDAERHIDRAVEIGRDFGHFHHTAHNIASAYAAMNEFGDAVKWLEAAADTGFPNFTYFLIDPNLNSLRTDRRFADFMNGLKAQWQRYKALI